VTPEWPDEGLAHRVTVSFEVPSGPGVEIAAAELLLDVLQRFSYQGLRPIAARLDITTVPTPPTS
jgi:hypothetical protein